MHRQHTRAFAFANAFARAPRVRRALALALPLATGSGMKAHYAMFGKRINNSTHKGLIMPRSVQRETTCSLYINRHIEKSFPSKQHTESSTEEGEQTCACQHGPAMCELFSRRISTGPRPSAPRACSARRYLAHGEPVAP